MTLRRRVSTGAYWARRAVGMGQTLLAEKSDDEFVYRLQQVVPGMLHPGNVRQFDHVMEHLPSDAPMLEIGAFCGLSTNVLTYLARRHLRVNELITCDPWDYQFKGLSDRPIGESDTTGYEWGRFAKATFQHATETFSNSRLPYALELGSAAVFTAWRAHEAVIDIWDRPLDAPTSLSFVYIDGNHDYEHVREDWDNAAPLVERGGFVLLDDSARYTGSPGVRQLVAEVRSDGRFALEGRNPNVLFRRR